MSVISQDPEANSQIIPYHSGYGECPWVKPSESSQRWNMSSNASCVCFYVMVWHIYICLCTLSFYIMSIF